jgi:hypothetical protein
VERIAREVLPPDFGFDWGGASYQEKRSSGTSGVALLLGALMVFLILSAQYEKWSLPLSVMLALPFGTFGALAAVWLREMTNDVYFQIGLVTLLGLAAKNAILIVQYASQKVHEGMSASAGRARGGAAALPADHHDLAGLHPLACVPLAFSSARRRRATLGRHGRDGRHARRHLPRDLLRADVLQDHHGARLREQRSTEEIQAEARARAPRTAARPARTVIRGADNRRCPRCPARREAGMKPRRVTTRAAVLAAVAAGRLRVPPAERHETPQLELPVVAAICRDVPANGGRASTTDGSTRWSPRRWPTTATGARDGAHRRVARRAARGKGQPAAQGRRQCVGSRQRFGENAPLTIGGNQLTFNDFRANLSVAYEVDLWSRAANLSAAARDELLASEYGARHAAHGAGGAGVRSYARCSRSTRRWCCTARQCRRNATA